MYETSTQMRQIVKVNEVDEVVVNAVDEVGRFSEINNSVGGVGEINGVIKKAGMVS